MNREFTQREKVLLLVLAVLIIVIGYVKLILQPINEEIESYESLTMEEQTTFSANQIKATRMNLMEKEIEKAKAKGVRREVPAYDNSSNLLPGLYQIMESSVDYSLDFGELVYDGNVVQRPVEMTFQTRTYKQARAIIDKLYKSGYAMQITDVNIGTKKATDTQLVSTSMSVTYFEENLNYVPEADIVFEDGTDAQSADGSADGSGQGLAGM